MRTGAARLDGGGRCVRGMAKRETEEEEVKRTTASACLFADLAAKRALSQRQKALAARKGQTPKVT